MQRKMDVDLLIYAHTWACSSIDFVADYCACCMSICWNLNTKRRLYGKMNENRRGTVKRRLDQRWLTQSDFLVLNVSYYSFE